MAPPQLSTLPPELLDQIVAGMDPTDSASLAALARTSRRFQALVTPTLYHTVAFNIETALEVSTGSRRLLAFVGQMLAAPDRLAPLVRDFRIEGPPEVDDDFSLVADMVREHRRQWPDEHPILRAWEAVEVPSWAGTRWDGAEYVGMLASLLLPRLSTLRCSRFGGLGSSEGLPLVMEIMERVAAQTPGAVTSGVMPFWQELEEVELNGGYDEYPSGPDPIAFFAQWPSVRRIYSAGYISFNNGNRWVTRDFRSLRPSSSALESLVLGPDTHLNDWQQDELLRAPRALRIFRYNVGYIYTNFGFRTEPFQRSLEHQRHSLEEVSLLYRYYQWGFNRSGELSNHHDFGPVSLAAFARLRVLEISLPFVFGQAVLCLENGSRPRRCHGAADPSAAEQRACAARLLEMLPPSVETVRFAQCCDRWASRLLAGALDALVDEVRVGVGGRFPALRAVEVHLYLGCYPPPVSYGIEECLEASLCGARAAGMRADIVEEGHLCSEDAYGMALD
ncbi:hypothetical protein PG985_001728 [Apiospora marii]|uniref:uncharacterized protein n=1 Tax=Apiospora marii TaxID=335849 RepID=UPI00312F559B